MFTSQEVAADAGVAIDMYDLHLLRLLVVRAALIVDPAPEFPPVDEIPSNVRIAMHEADQSLLNAWRIHWGNTLLRLDRPNRQDPPQREVMLWPSLLPDVDEKGVVVWRRALPATPRGTSLQDRPSYQYYLARAENSSGLPRRLIVLPLRGEFSKRVSGTAGIVSASSFFGSSDPTFGLSHS